MDDGTPKGYHRIKSYTNGYQIVILGMPPEFDEGDPLQHNCDEMGCGWGEHVLDRVPVMRPLAPGVMPLPDLPEVTDG